MSVTSFVFQTDPATAGGRILQVQWANGAPFFSTPSASEARALPFTVIKTLNATGTSGTMRIVNATGKSIYTSQFAVFNNSYYTDGILTAPFTVNGQVGTVSVQASFSSSLGAAGNSLNPTVNFGKSSVSFSPVDTIDMQVTGSTIVLPSGDSGSIGTVIPPDAYTNGGGRSTSTTETFSVNTMFTFPPQKPIDGTTPIYYRMGANGTIELQMDRDQDGFFQHCQVNLYGNNTTTIRIPSIIPLDIAQIGNVYDMLVTANSSTGETVYDFVVVDPCTGVPQTITNFSIPKSSLIPNTTMNVTSPDHQFQMTLSVNVDGTSIQMSAFQIGNGLCGPVQYKQLPSYYELTTGSLNGTGNIVVPLMSVPSSNHVAYILSLVCLCQAPQSLLLQNDSIGDRMIYGITAREKETE